MNLKIYCNHWQQLQAPYSNPLLSDLFLSVFPSPFLNSSCSVLICVRTKADMSVMSSWSIHCLRQIRRQTASLAQEIYTTSGSLMTKACSAAKIHRYTLNVVNFGTGHVMYWVVENGYLISNRSVFLNKSVCKTISFISYDCRLQCQILLLLKCEWGFPPYEPVRVVALPR